MSGFKMMILRFAPGFFEGKPRSNKKTNLKKNYQQQNAK